MVRLGEPGILPLRPIIELNRLRGLHGRQRSAHGHGRSGAEEVPSWYLVLDEWKLQMTPRTKTFLLTVNL